MSVDDPQQQQHHTYPQAETTPVSVKMAFVRDIAWYLIVALLIVIPFRAYVAQPFYVSGASMEPTFRNGEYLVIDELSYLMRDPARGEVVVFRFPREPSLFFIKRIVGVPGDEVFIKGDEVFTKTPRGTLIPWEAPIRDIPSAQALRRYHLGEDEYFVVGDNRHVSYDSRMWGPIKRTHIVGRVLVRLFPLSRLGWEPGAVPAVPTAIDASYESATRP